MNMLQSANWNRGDTESLDLHLSFLLKSLVLHLTAQCKANNKLPLHIMAVKTRSIWREILCVFLPKKIYLKK